MRYLKMFGLAAVAACALTAFVGAATASAGGVLCENLSRSTGCATDTHVNVGSTLEFTLEPATSKLLKGPFGETLATCTVDTIGAKTTTTGSSTESVLANITFLVSGPYGDTPPCTVTVNSLGSLEITNITGTKNGTVRTTGTTIILHNTPLFGECKYSTNSTTLGTLTGSSNTGGAATLDVNGTLSSHNGCPTASWTGKYFATGITSKYNVTR